MLEERGEEEEEEVEEVEKYFLTFKSCMNIVIPEVVTGPYDGSRIKGMAFVTDAHVLSAPGRSLGAPFNAQGAGEAVKH